MKQSVSIIFRPNSPNTGNYYDYASGTQLNSTSFESGQDLYFGYDNGFSATYSVSPIPGTEDYLYLTLKFTSKEDSSITNTQVVELPSPSSIAAMSCNVYTSDDFHSFDFESTTTDQDIDELFVGMPGVKQTVLFNVHPSKQIPIGRKEIDSSNTDLQSNTGEDEAVQDSNSTLEEDIEAAKAKSSAIEEIVNSEEPVGELAAVALSLLSFTVPWEFFTMCLEIIF